MMASALPGILAMLGAAPVAAQPLAERVAAAGDGMLSVRYATRPGVCGDGRRYIAVNESASYFHGDDGRGFGGRGVMTRCVPGPARVALTVAGGRPTALRVRVGGADTAAGGRDLGEVTGAEAGGYFLALARTSGATVGRDALLAAVIADDFEAAPGLETLLADATRPDDVRAMAAHLLPAVAGEGAVATLDRVASDRRTPRAVREAAMAGLADAGEAGVSALVRHAEGADLALARRAAFWLGQSESPRAHALLRDLAGRARADRTLRGEAIFALGHGAAVAGDAAFLRALYARLDDDGLRERLLQSVAHMDQDQEENAAWLIGIARDDRAPFDQRKKALFWAGQGEAAATPKLVEVYRGVRDRALREHAIFVLSLRDDDAALDALIDIARREQDRELRKKALFWLGQKDDPRAEALIRDLVLGQ
jgi:hypothetical protein